MEFLFHIRTELLLINKNSIVSLDCNVFLITCQYILLKIGLETNLQY